MAIVNGYVDLADFRQWNSIQATDKTEIQEQAIEAASRWVESHCQRQFWLTDPEARVFDAACGTTLRFGPFDDLAELTTVQTDDDGDGTYGAAWSLSDYQLWPRRTASAPEQRPYREIRAVGAFRFPYVASIGTSVKVTGRWGWPEVPTPVRQACLIQASRLYKRSQSPEGVTGFGSEFGAIRLSARPDPDVVALLAPYRLTAVLVA